MIYIAYRDNMLTVLEYDCIMIILFSNKYKVIISNNKQDNMRVTFLEYSFRLMRYYL